VTAGAVVCGLVGVVVVSVAVALRAIRTERFGLQVVSKTLASLGFVAIGALAAGDASSFGRLVVMGLMLCALGDVLLLWDRTFDPGLWAFLSGHVAYVAAFAVALPMAEWRLEVALPLTVVAVLVGCWLWPHLGRRKASVSAYIAVISVMVLAAVSAALAGPVGWMPAVGAVLFYFSDLTVARHRFVQAAFVNRAVGLPLYYAGQVLIALSI
jgi:uncharacterized membrane protein YhhN